MLLQKIAEQQQELQRVLCETEGLITKVEETGFFTLGDFDNINGHLNQWIKGLETAEEREERKRQEEERKRKDEEEKKKRAEEEAKRKAEEQRRKDEEEKRRKEAIVYNFNRFLQKVQRKLYCSYQISQHIGLQMFVKKKIRIIQS